MSRRRRQKATAFKTAKRFRDGRLRNKPQAFPLFDTKAAAKRRQKLSGQARETFKSVFSGKPFATPGARPTEDLRVEAAESLHKKIVRAKILATGGSMNDIDRAIKLLEKELGITAGAGVAAVFGRRVHPSQLLAADPTFIDTMQHVLNSRYAWNIAKTSADPHRKELIRDEAAREILGISVPTIGEIRIRYPTVADKITEEERRRLQLEEKLPITRAKAKVYEAYRKFKQKIRELEELPLPPKAIRRKRWRKRARPYRPLEEMPDVRPTEIEMAEEREDAERAIARARKTEEMREKLKGVPSGLKKWFAKGKKRIEREFTEEALRAQREKEGRGMAIKAVYAPESLEIEEREE